MNNEINYVSPFTRFCISIGNLPTAYLESMSYYESLTYLVNYLANNVIPALNNNGEVVEEVQAKFVELKNYVDNYFENLDVQEEINKKLDKMAIDGTLTQLIKRYVDPIYEEFENQITEDMNTFKTNINQEIDTIDTKVTNIASGSPLPASSVSEMTDTTRIYVNTTDGYWYYYDGDSWERGGVYEATQLGDESITPDKFATFLDSSLYDTISVEDNTRISGYEPATHQINRITNNLWITYKIDLSDMKNTIKFDRAYNVASTHGAHTVCSITAADENFIQGFSYNSASNITGVTYTDESRLLIVDVEAVKLNYSNAKYMFICFFKENAVNIISNSNIDLPLWFNIDNQNELDEINAKIDKINEIEIDIPSHVTAIVGHEINFYKDTLIHSNNNEQYDMRVGIPGLNGRYVDGHNYGNVYRFTPTALDIGTRSCTVYAINKLTQETVLQKTFTLDIIADNLASNTKVMFIGDSLTEAGYYPAEIVHNLSDRIDSIGTLETTVSLGGESLTTHHEGRAGWSAIDYVTYEETKDHTNAFWNPQTEKFDFTYYMNKNEYTNIDVVFLNLGTNDINRTDDNINAFKEMITSIHTYNPSIKILVSLVNYGALQSGWGTRGASLASKYNYDALKLHTAMKEELAELNNVYLTAPYINLDSVNDFDTINVPASSRNPKIITIENNTVHPSVYGYLKLADMFYNELVYRINN